jgi:threonine/homoserine/homoserine lactone efflux protein
MLEAILSGITLGLLLAILIGPVFFMLLNTSIKKGFVPAAYLAFGVMLSDAFFIVVSYYGSAFVGLFNNHKFEVGLGGGGILIIFGLVNMLKKPADANLEPELPDDSKSLLIDTGKGFIMNSMNPFVLVFWVGVSGTLAAKEHFTHFLVLIFFLTTLCTVLSTDLLKAWLASRLKNLIRPVFLLWLNRLSGLGLILFGFKMIWSIMK